MEATLTCRSSVDWHGDDDLCSSGTGTSIGLMTSDPISTVTTKPSPEQKIPEMLISRQIPQATQPPKLEEPVNSLSCCQTCSVRGCRRDFYFYLIGCLYFCHYSTCLLPINEAMADRALDCVIFIKHDTNTHEPCGPSMVPCQIWGSTLVSKISSQIHYLSDSKMLTRTIDPFRAKVGCRHSAQVCKVQKHQVSGSEGGAREETLNIRKARRVTSFNRTIGTLCARTKL